MFWSTWWALVLGFSLSGMVQAFVSKSQMTRVLGDHSAKSILTATGLGAASSSCSYAASAMSRSLVARGADFTTAMVFLFASTNLVIELGIVLVVLVGWTFMAAEFVGGVIMVLLLALVGSRVFSRHFEAKLRERMGPDEVVEAPVEGQRPWRHLAGWADAATYGLADLTMLRKELFIGYTVAGFLGALVPQTWWSTLFLAHHGALSVVENVLIGPLIAVVSWVCSVGNVPLAATLWAGGISFGGVIAFIFADLISFQLILVYRRFYGWRIALTMSGVFYVVMVLAALATQGVFALFHLTPAHTGVLVTRSVGGVLTNSLNLFALVVGLGGWWFSRQRARFGGGVGYAIDPVCGMQVRTSDAPARATRGDETYYFCAERCQRRFLDEHPEARGNGALLTPRRNPTREENIVRDPVCHMECGAESAATSREYEGETYYFCALSCAEAFDKDPEAYASPEMTVLDPVCRMRVRVSDALGPVNVSGVDYYFCNPGCRGAFEAAPERFTPSGELSAIDPVCHMSVEPSHAAASREYEGETYYFCALSCAVTFEASPAHFLHSTPTRGS